MDRGFLGVPLLSLTDCWTLCFIEGHANAYLQDNRLCYFQTWSKEGDSLLNIKTTGLRAIKERSPATHFFLFKE